MAFFAVDLLPAVFLAVDLAAALRPVDFFAVDFFAADFLAVLRPVDFLAVDFLAVDFLAVDFLAVDFLAVDFLAVDFLAADEVLPAAFLVADAAFLAVDFFVPLLLAVAFLPVDLVPVAFLPVAAMVSLFYARGRGRHSAAQQLPTVCAGSIPTLRNRDITQLDGIEATIRRGAAQRGGHKRPSARGRNGLHR